MISTRSCDSFDVDDIDKHLPSLCYHATRSHTQACMFLPQDVFTQYVSENRTSNVEQYT